MKSVKSHGILAAVGIVVAMLGVVVPIVWAHYTGRMSLLVVLLSEESVDISELLGDRYTISIHGSRDGVDEIDNITAVRLLIKNSGRRPIRSSDIVVPVEIKLNGSVLNGKITRTSPDGVSAQIVETSDGSVIVDIPLLNPGDVLEILITGKSAEKNTLAVSGRIVGIKSFDEVDRRNDVPEVPKKFGISEFVILSASTMAWFMALGSVIMLRDERSGIRTLTLEAVPESEFQNHYVSLRNRAIASIDTRSCRRKLGSIDADFITDVKSYTAAIECSIEIIRKEMRSSKIAGAISVVLGVVGLVYLYIG